MTEAKSNSNFDQILKKDGPQLAALLKEMKEGLDVVRSKVEGLTAKVKAKSYPTADGISYLEAKHLLLLNYCQSLVYYSLRKAKGLPIENHPVVRSLVEIRLFLEKIRPIDKKMEYQIQKLTKDSVHTMEQQSMAHEKTGDLLNFRPNPDMLVEKTDSIPKDGDVYRPPKFAPTIMDDDEKVSKQEKNALRKGKQTQRVASKGYIKDLIDDMEGRPEEIKDSIGDESREFVEYKKKWEDRSQREEELFTRAPVTKMEKKKEKHLMRSRHGLNALTDDFYDEIKALPLEDNTATFNKKHSAGKLKKRKRRH